MSTEQIVDYQGLYDGYWQSPDRVGESSGDVSRLATLIAETCGYGSVIDIGCGEGLLVKSLLSLGIDAVGLDVSKVVVERANLRCPNRFFEGSILSTTFPDGRFDAVVSTDCMEHLAPEDVPAALREMYRISSRYVFLQIATTQDRDQHWHLTVENREWWEARCFEAGFRKHPLYYKVNPYESLNKDNWQIFVLLEKVPTRALQEYDLFTLVEERLLHTDMLREFGRRSDAHCIRYHKAAEWIRPGDRVLDVACGLGYGSHILYHASPARSVLGVDLSDFSIAYANAHYAVANSVEFLVGDAQSLDFIEDHSIDFIAAFETIEHVPDPIAYLSELKRVLKPAGRIMVCAPNNWVDETGKDPNPYHLHVYTWERLVKEIGQFFLLEKGFLQTAGGAMKCHHDPRKWSSVSVDKTPEEDSEWVLLLGMADPLGGGDVPYEETMWNVPTFSEFNVSAFARDYINPWLVKSMVSRGIRANSKVLLYNMQEQVLASYDSNSVDYGAALCGRVYSYQRLDNVSADLQKKIDFDIACYAAIAAPSPHQLRWQVSLLFAGGELARKQGRVDNAIGFYSRCVALDVLAYSPLLGNKVMDALHWLAVFAMSRHKKDLARTYLLQSVANAKKLVSGSWVNVIGDPEAPLPFGLAELAQLLDKASRAANMLSVLDQAVDKGGMFFQKSTGFFEKQQLESERRLDNSRQAVGALSSQVSEKDRICLNFAQEILKQDAHAQELAREVAKQDAHAQELAREIAQKDAYTQELAREVAKQDAHAQALAREIAQKDAYTQELACKIAEQDVLIQELKNKLAHAS